MNAKHKLFADEYLIDLCASKAAKRAGYSEQWARDRGWRVLQRADVQAYLAERMTARAERTEITQDMVLRELAKIGFSDIRKAVKWGESVVGIHPDTGQAVAVHDIMLTASDQVDADTAAAISEVSQTQQGLKVKLHDKRAALVDIGRHLGMFTDKVEVTGKDGAPLGAMPTLPVDPIEAARVYQKVMSGEG
jgi:phage terminase small subunit